MTDGKLLHACGSSPTSGAAPHAVRAWRCALLHFQVWEFSGEASIVAVLGLQSFDLLPTFFPVHSGSFAPIDEFAS